MSDGKFDKGNFIRCTQTALQSVNNTIFLTGQTITQANDHFDTNVNEATAIVENVLKFQEGSTTIIEIVINDETVSGTFVNGATVTGTSSVLMKILVIGVTVSQAVSTTTITNDGSTLTVGDEATISGGGGSGVRIQVQDLSGGGVDEVIVNVLVRIFKRVIL